MHIIRVDLHWRYKTMRRHIKCGNSKQMLYSLNLIYSYSFNLLKGVCTYHQARMIMHLILSLFVGTMLIN